MNVYSLVVQYDGTAYAGFQIQRGLPTIQGELEKALQVLAQEAIRVAGAGRTDAGVHSEGQTVSFQSPALTVPVKKLPYALNRLLPRDIQVVNSALREKGFHAQYDAVAKTYRYQVYHGPFPNVFWQRYALWEKKALDWEAMAQAARLLQGTLDFAAFAASGSQVKTSVRTMYSVDLDARGELKMIRFTADGFLYKMVRNMVGTLLDVGRGKLGSREMESILEKGDRHLAGATAPSQGLFFESVKYLDTEG